MVKKIFIVILLCLIFILLFGCGNKSTSNLDDEQYEPQYTPSNTIEETVEETPESSKLEIVDGWKWTGNDGYTYINGRVKNTGNQIITYFKLVAEYLDSQGNVLDSDFTNSIEKIYPNNQKEFEIMHKYDAQYTKARIYLEEYR